MFKTIFIYLWLMYIVLTESLFMKFFTLFIFYTAIKFARTFTKNSYYPQKEIYD